MGSMQCPVLAAFEVSGHFAQIWNGSMSKLIAKLHHGVSNGIGHKLIGIN